tara:strand:- start:303 stop:551 length:249 start_codon:yes stop_codon:yes gene_type:complete
MITNTTTKLTLSQKLKSNLTKIEENSDIYGIDYVWESKNGATLSYRGCRVTGDWVNIKVTTEAGTFIGYRELTEAVDHIISL